jgi:hypothetical protein
VIIELVKSHSEHAGWRMRPRRLLAAAGAWALLAGVGHADPLLLGQGFGGRALLSQRPVEQALPSQRPVRQAFLSQAGRGRELLGQVSGGEVERALDLINMAVNWRVSYDPGVKWSEGRIGDCTTFALQKYEAAQAQGFDPAIWQVVDPHGAQHAVVQVGDWVLDSEQERAERREVLERVGYVFESPIAPGSEQQVAVSARVKWWGPLHASP